MISKLIPLIAFQASVLLTLIIVRDSNCSHIFHTYYDLPLAALSKALLAAEERLLIQIADHELEDDIPDLVDVLLPECCMHCGAS